MSSDSSQSAVLDAVTEINNLLLGPIGPQHLFTGVSEVIAHAFCYPFAAVLLFDVERRTLHLAGVNNGRITEMLKADNLGGTMRPDVTLSELHGAEWVEPFLACRLHVTHTPEDLATHFFSPGRALAWKRYLGIRLGAVVPLIARDRLVGAVIIASRRNEIDEREADSLQFLARHAAVALEMWRLYTTLQDQESERAALLRQVLTGQEAERRRIAVSIHDGALQSIGTNLLSVDRARKHLVEGRTNQALDELASLREEMLEVVGELRAVLSDLRPALLEMQGLMLAARVYLEGFSKSYGIESNLHDRTGGERLPSTVELVFYRLMQEALTNVRKHA